MAEILQDFPINAPPERVFQTVSTAEGLDNWWTKKAGGTPIVGSELTLGFGPEYDWRAQVIMCVPNETIELRMTRADSDWIGTSIEFRLESRAGKTWVRFHHTGWPEANEHYRISCHCWAMYLRVLRRYLEHGECVPYEERLDV